MTLFGALAIILFAYGVALLGQCSGLKCKSGKAIDATGFSPFINATIEECEFQQHYCLTAYCIAEGNTSSFTTTYWQCAWTNEVAQCAIRFENFLKNLKAKNPRCHCKYGEPNENMTNANPPGSLANALTSTIEPPPSTAPPTPPTSNLTCLIGAYDHNGYGLVKDEQCNKEDQFCVVANYTTAADNKSKMVWSCARSTDCDSIAKRYAKDSYTCQCQFGKQDVKLSNEHPIMTSEKPPHTDETPLRCLLLEFACKKSEHANAKPGRRFKTKENCAKVKGRVEEMTKHQMELLSEEFFNGKDKQPLFLEDFCCKIGR